MEEKEIKSKLTKREKFKLECGIDPDLKGFSGKRREMLYALKLTLANFTQAAAMIGVSRAAIYKAMKESPEFSEKVEELKDMGCDFVDSKLMDRVREGDTTAIIWYDKTRGRHKDQLNKMQIDHTTQGEKINSNPVVFVSADQLSPEQLQALINKDITSGPGGNDQST